MTTGPGPADAVPTDQEWFWAAEWQAGERAIEVGRGRGERGLILDSAEAFLEHLGAQRS
ncbi:hypothetical protein AB0M43_33120 [Longispora sp. NPDC051575]|uniref:hypothetical protein n=1 Tax=Longispora sp. NPDC051575 TaxID=3154943 RepID=UPI003412421F